MISASPAASGAVVTGAAERQPVASGATRQTRQTASRAGKPALRGLTGIAPAPYSPPNFELISRSPMALTSSLRATSIISPGRCSAS